MDEIPYRPPTKDSVELKKQGKHKVFTVVGLVLYSGPLLGSIGTVIGMISAFGSLSSDGGGEPAAFADDINTALVSTMIGLIVGLVGAVFVLLALLRFKVTFPWLFGWAFGLSVVWCLVVFPYGLIVGLVVGGIFWSRRSQLTN